MLGRTALVGLAALATACSSGYSSGVEGSKPVSTLSASEAALACENLADYLVASFPQSEQDRFACTVRALLDVTLDPAGCRSAVTACLVEPPSAGFDFGSIDCTGATADPTCTATVAATEACVTAEVQAYQDRLAQVDCAIAGNVPALQALEAPVPVPTACSNLGTSCPDMADGIIPR